MAGNCVPAEFISVSRRATGCDDCFVRFRVERPTIDIAQPRWIGPDYKTSNPRVLILMLNPGSGDGRADDADRHFRKLLHDFHGGSVELASVMEHQRADIPNWGRGRMAKSLTLSGLSLDRIALMNVAWCATKGNKYPGVMLRHCFSKFTAEAILILNPDVIVLCGSSVHGFLSQLSNLLPRVRFFKSLHYAHRKGQEATRRNAEALSRMVQKKS